MILNNKIFREKRLQQAITAVRQFLPACLVSNRPGHGALPPDVLPGRARGRRRCFGCNRAVERDLKFS